MNVKLKAISVLAGLPAVRGKMFDMIFSRDSGLPFEPMPENGMTARMREEREAGEALLKTLPEEHILLRNSRGDRIHARIFLNGGITDRFVILCHGYRSRGLPEFTGLLPQYMNQPVSLLVIDHQAAGESEGSLITFGWQEHIDLLQWVRYLAGRFGPETRVLLHGISMGAATVLLASGSPGLPPQVKRVVADCGYTSLEAELRHCFDFWHIPESAIPDILERFRRRTGILPGEISPLEAVKRCSLPLSLIHGTEDTFVPYAMGEELHAACPHSTLLSVKGAGHAESRQRDRAAYAHVL